MLTPPRRVSTLLVITALIAIIVLPLAHDDGSRQALATSGGAPPGLLKIIAKITSDPRYAHATWGVGVQDLDNGTALLGLEAETMFVTGSILKVFSNATALHLYGPDYQFHTPVYRTGKVDGGVLTKNLVLVASGDLSMGLREKPDGTMVYDSAPIFDHTYANTGFPSAPVDGDPLAGLNSLAEQVASSGITEVDGNVLIDDRLFETSFAWPDATVSPMTPIWINDNRVDITTTPTSVGQPATVQWRPVTAAYAVQGHPTTVAAGQPTELEVTQPSPGVFSISGQIAADAGPALRVGEIPDPASVARTEFIEALRRAGVDVTADPTGPNPGQLLPPLNSYRTDARVAEHVSGQLKELTRVILKVSHNPGADLMACLDAVAVGSTDCEDGLVAETDYFESLGVSPDEVFIFDGAGSDERDRATPDAMTGFFRAVAGQPIGAAFHYGLAILGVDGDLANTLKDSPAAGHIRAKDGFRTGFTAAGQGLITARTMVGYVDAKSGRQVLEAVMVRDVPVSSVDDLFDVVNDVATIAAAIWQAY